MGSGGGWGPRDLWAGDGLRRISWDLGTRVPKDVVRPDACSPGEDLEDAPVYVHPAGLHRAALGGQVHSGLARLSLPAAAHGAPEALPPAPALPGQGATGGKGRCLGQS